MSVRSVTPLAQDIVALELCSTTDGELPAFTAGAHIDLHLPDGMVRSYSLVNAQHERHRYVIAVNRDSASRGGSTWIHDRLQPGSTVLAGAPRNNFALVEDAAHSFFLAGGIGITPLWCMVQRLESLRRPWSMMYCARTEARAAFHAELSRFGTSVRFNFDQGPGGTMIDVAELVARAPADAHLYCCGPVSMLQAFEQAAAGLPSERVHVEYFSAAQPAALDGGFMVVLQRSGRSIRIAPGKTIMDALIEHSIDAPYSCLEGVCGTCETRVIEGIPDHRDLVLSKQERLSNRTMMICCSGSKTERLVLDL